MRRSKEERGAYFHTCFVALHDGGGVRPFGRSFDGLSLTALRSATRAVRRWAATLEQLRQYSAQPLDACVLVIAYMPMQLRLERGQGNRSREDAQRIVIAKRLADSARQRRDQVRA
jgi:hypothetical protein